MRDPTKPLPEHNMILHCQICGRKVGSVYSREPLTEDQYRTRGGIVDQRCSECETTHGTFRELLDTYKKETGDDEGKAETFIKKNRKRGDFDKALLTEKSKRLKGKGGIINNK